MEKQIYLLVKIQNNRIRTTVPVPSWMSITVLVQSSNNIIAMAKKVVLVIRTL